MRCPPSARCRADARDGWCDPIRYGEPRDAIRDEVIDVPRSGRTTCSCDDGGRRELQQRLGGARRAGRRHEDPGAMGRADRLPHRRVRRGGIVYAVGADVSGRPGRRPRHGAPRAVGSRTIRGSSLERTRGSRRTLPCLGVRHVLGLDGAVHKVQATSACPRPTTSRGRKPPRRRSPGRPRTGCSTAGRPTPSSPGTSVLVWGGAAGSGSLAVQLVTNAGGRRGRGGLLREKGEYCKAARRGRLRRPEGLRPLGRAPPRGTHPTGRAGSTARRHSARRSGTRSARRSARGSCSNTRARTRSRRRTSCAIAAA